MFASLVSVWPWAYFVVRLGVGVANNASTLSIATAVLLLQRQQHQIDSRTFAFVGMCKVALPHTLLIIMSRKKRAYVFTSQQLIQLLCTTQQPKS